VACTVKSGCRCKTRTGNGTEKPRDEMMLYESLYPSVLRDKRQFSGLNSNRLKTTLGLITDILYSRSVDSHCPKLQRIPLTREFLPAAPTHIL
jgi:hypothetical protein